MKETENCGKIAKNGVHKDRERSQKICQRWIHRRVLKRITGSWECIRRKDGQCRATVKIPPTDELIEQINDLSHAPSPTQVEETKSQGRNETQSKSNRKNSTTNSRRTIEQYL